MGKPNNPNTNVYRDLSGGRPISPDRLQEYLDAIFSLTNIRISLENWLAYGTQYVEEATVNWMSSSAFDDLLEEPWSTDPIILGHRVATVPYHRAIVSFIHRFSPPNAMGESVRTLDLGAGGGRVAYELSRLGYKVVAVDNSPPVVDFLKKVAFGGEIEIAVPILGKDARRMRVRLEPAPHDSCHFEVRELDGCNLQSLADSSFDVVVLSALLDRVNDPFKVVAEVRRVLRAGGIVVASCSFDWKHTFTPEESSWRSDLAEFFPQGVWKHLHSIDWLPYRLRINARFAEDNLAQVLVAAK